MTRMMTTPEWMWWYAIAPTTAANATVDPTDKSMPRVKITSNMPIDSNEIVAVWSSTLPMFPVVRNLSDKNFIASTSTSNMSPGPMRINVSATRRALYDLGAAVLGPLNWPDSLVGGPGATTSAGAPSTAPSAGSPGTRIEDPPGCVVTIGRAVGKGQEWVGKGRALARSRIAGRTRLYRSNVIYLGFTSIRYPVVSCRPDPARHVAEEPSASRTLKLVAIASPVDKGFSGVRVPRRCSTEAATCGIDAECRPNQPAGAPFDCEHVHATRHINLER